MPARDSLAHQYTHYYLRTRVGDGLPLWFEDGLATLMHSADLHEDHAIFYQPRMPLRHRVITMESLLRIDRKSSDYVQEEPYRFFFQDLMFGTA